MTERCPIKDLYSPLRSLIDVRDGADGEESGAELCGALPGALNNTAGVDAEDDAFCATSCATSGPEHANVKTVTTEVSASQSVLQDAL